MSPVASRAQAAESAPHESQSLINREAVHLAGHIAVACGLLGLEDAQRSCPPFHAARPISDGELPKVTVTEARLLADVAIAHGGLVAEEIILRSRGLSSAFDLHYATALVLARIDAGLEATVPYSVAALGSYLSDRGRTRVTAAVARRMNSARHTAELIVLDNRAATEELARALAVTGDLAGPDLADAIGRAGFVSFWSAPTAA